MFRRRVQQTQTELTVDFDKCYACGACVAVCPPDALFLHDLRLTIDQNTCTRCDRCVAICPVQALALVPTGSGAE